MRKGGKKKKRKGCRAPFSGRSSGFFFFLGTVLLDGVVGFFLFGKTNGAVKPWSQLEGGTTSFLYKEKDIEYVVQWPNGWARDTKNGPPLPLKEKKIILSEKQHAL